MNDAKQKIDQLKQLIRTWDYEYYVTPNTMQKCAN